MTDCRKSKRNCSEACHLITASLMMGTQGNVNPHGYVGLLITREQGWSQGTVHSRVPTHWFDNKITWYMRKMWKTQRKVRSAAVKLCCLHWEESWAGAVACFFFARMNITPKSGLSRGQCCRWDCAKQSLALLCRCTNLEKKCILSKCWRHSW